jgi:hypothetical protein
MKDGERHNITVKKGEKIRKDIDPKKICYIVEEVAYWRKANHIHKWFVDNVQSGNDDCGKYYVSQDQLKDLVALCEQVINSVETVEGDISMGTTYHPDGTVEKHTVKGQVIAQKEMAKNILPTQSGFFFGTTDYDEYYLNDCRSTIKMLKPYLKDESSGDFEYRSSW